MQVQESRESLFTEALFGMLGLHLMREREEGRLTTAGPEIERVDENRLLWKFGGRAMSITVNEVPA